MSPPDRPPIQARFARRFLTAAGIQALAGMGFLWKAYDYLSGVIPDLEILVAALKKR